MYRKILVLLLFLNFSACVSPNEETPEKTQTAVQPTSTLLAVVSPTDTPLTFPTEPPPTDTPDPALLHPKWFGGITHADGTTEAILVQLDETDGSLTIQPFSNPLTIEVVERTGVMISFQVSNEREIAFTGALDGKLIAGEVEENEETAVFVLSPMIEGSAPLEDYAGTYQFESGEALTVHISPSFSGSGLDFFWDGLTITDFDTGAIRGLYPVAEDRFLVGSARVIGYPFGAEITFVREGMNVTGLAWRDLTTGEPGEARQATELELSAETMTYISADGITLTGLLTLPETPGPHPAIVVLHGSERGERNDFFREQLRTFFASQGIATLTYDKRGVGDSGGTYRESASEENLTLLAQDVVAGVNYLQSRPEVDAGKIGLIGGSQAGWVIPLAAQSEEVAYFIILSGPVVSTGIENAYSELTNDGESPVQHTSEEISQLLTERTPSGFDPVPVIATLTQPGLWLWGSVDQSVPVPESVENLEALIAEGKENFSFEIFPNADHNLQQSEGGLFVEIPFSEGFVEGMFGKIGEWVRGL
jgi:uncharacterized protein